MTEKPIKGGSGFRPDIPDPRDFRLPKLAGSFNWYAGFDVEEVVGELPYVNQQQTLSCVACATTAYQVALHRKIGTLKGDIDMYFSVRDLYSQIFLPGGAAYIRDAMKVVTDKGQVSEAIFPTPPWTETHLEDRKDANQEDLDTAKMSVDASYYTVIGQDIDSFALAMQQGFGCVSGISSSSSGHCMYAKKAYLKNGVKTIRFHNSYGKGSDLEYTADDFRSSSFSIINPWVLIPNTSMPNIVDQTRLDKLYLLAFGRLPDIGAAGYVNQDEDFVIDQLNNSAELQAKHALSKTADNYFNVK